MKRAIITFALFMSVLLTGCSAQVSEDLPVSLSPSPAELQDEIQTEVTATESPTESHGEQLLVGNMSDAERNSITIGEFNYERTQYKDQTYGVDTAYLQEMTIYDEELDRAFIVHIALPPNYDATKTYPMYMMTDGIWRIYDHHVTRQLMLGGEIEDIIAVSVGYDYDYNENTIWRATEFVTRNSLFLDFLTNNLIPYLGGLYRIDNGRSALVGSSLGGAFVHYAAFISDEYESQPFQYFVIGSPAFTFIEETVAAGVAYTKSAYTEFGFFDRNTEFHKEIFVVAGGKEEDAMLQGVEMLLDRMDEHGVTTVDSKIYEDDDHTSYLDEMTKDSLILYYGKTS